MFFTLFRARVLPAALFCFCTAFAAHAELAVWEQAPPLWEEQVPMYHPDFAPATLLGGGVAMPPPCVAVGPEGSVYLAGVLYVPGANNSQVRDIVLVKYDKRGRREWARQIDEGHDDTVLDLAVDHRGNVYLAGSIYKPSTDGDARSPVAYAACYTAKGRLRWTYIEQGVSGPGVSTQCKSHYNAVTLAGDSAYFVGAVDGQVSRAMPLNPTRGDTLVTRIRADGRRLWSHQYQLDSSAHALSGNSITVGREGIYVAGSDHFLGSVRGRDRLNGYSQGFVQCVDGQGDRGWRQEIGIGPAAPGNRRADPATGLLRIGQDSQGRLYAYGFSDENLENQPVPDNFKGGLFLARFGPGGQPHWLSQAVALPESVKPGQRPVDMHIDPRDRVWVSSTSTVRAHHRLLIMEYDTDGQMLRLLHRATEHQYTGDTIAFDPDSQTLVVAGVYRPRAQGNGGLFDEDGRRAAQPNPPEPPQYYVMRLPLLEDLPEPAEPQR